MQLNRITNSASTNFQGRLITDTSNGIFFINLPSGRTEKANLRFRLLETESGALGFAEDDGITGLYELTSSLQAIPTQPSIPRGWSLASAVKNEMGWAIVMTNARGFEVVAKNVSQIYNGQFRGIAIQNNTDDLTVASEEQDGEILLHRFMTKKQSVLPLPSNITAIFKCFATDEHLAHVIVERDNSYPCVITQTERGEWTEAGNPVVVDAAIIHVNRSTFWWEVTEASQLLLRTLQLGEKRTRDLLSLEHCALEPAPRGPSLTSDGKHLVAVVLSHELCSQLIYVVHIPSMTIEAFTVAETFVRTVAIA